MEQKYHPLMEHVKNEKNKGIFKMTWGYSVKIFPAEQPDQTLLMP